MQLPTVERRPTEVGPTLVSTVGPVPVDKPSWGGVLHTWGFAIYRASHDDYETSYLPNGMPAGSPEEALDCACGLYLNDPTAWLPNTPTN